MRSEIGINIERDVNIHLENRLESRWFYGFIWLLYAVVIMTKNCFNAALTSIVAEGILTKSQMGHFSTVFYLAYAPFQIIGGLAADRYSPERLVKIGLYGAALANIVIFLNQNYYVMLAAWTFSGVVQFGLWPGIFKIISSQLVRSDRTNMTFYIWFASSFGLILSYLIGAMIIDWRINFVVSAAVLILFALVLGFYGRHLTPYMKWDRKENPKNGQSGERVNLSGLKVFAASGFFAVVIVSFMRTTLEQSSKTLVPLILMENYENISPRIGNLLNVLVLAAGIMGMIFVRKFLYPKRVKTELEGLIIVLAFAMPASMILVFVGKVSLSVAVAAFCVSSAAYTGSAPFMSFYSNSFVKYGKNATVAGIINATASLGMIAAGYVFLRVSEVWNWTVVITLWIVLILVSIILLLSIVSRYRRFKEITVYEEK